MRGDRTQLLLTGTFQSLTPVTPESLYSQAVTCIETLEYDDAEEKLLEVLRAVPDHKPALGLLAYVYFATGRPAQALACNEKALALSPDDPHLLNDIASNHYVMGEFDKAMGFYVKALEIRPDDAQFLLNLTTVSEGKAGEPCLSRL